MIKELKHTADIAAFLADEAEIFVIYDENVPWVAGEVVRLSPVRAAIGLETSEAVKTMDSVLALCRQLMEAGASRKALLLAIGGGITTDMVGFAASIYKRGIRYANLPTTLLSQVDAAIGGKTGVNLDGYKNMLGAFRMPEYTFLCADVLRTLPSREFRSGLAELLKTFLLGDGTAYNALLESTEMTTLVDEQAENAHSSTETASMVDEQAKNTPSSTKSPLSVDTLQKYIGKAAQIKADIVARDPYEQGERAKLNLGHTFAHAIEHQAQEQGDDITHGEAVAMGIILAARLGENLGFTENGLARRLTADWHALNLPAECPYDLETLKEAMTKDKKAQGGGKVKFVLPVRPGEVVFQELNPYDLHFDTK